ncbi:D-lactate dehydrogenase [Aerococcaceae bacterium DSM 109653]|uniref:D-lactate dehydrogenase n=1 Tax=Fundicoccus ignavus TaxID=2664442 RepID=A0A844C289_9LACT|nr:D-2-hydroxyacid dehydrogenase [Fundicoccus ignavus]MRI81651.1 D-lactate dehydrogenase [Fundicoccus ignavus]
MLKIMLFGVRDEEIPIIKAWSTRNEVQVDYTELNLTPETIQMAKGYDGVTISQVADLDVSLYPTLASYGIKQIAQRSAGFEMHDLTSATENGLIISNVPSYSPESIAEYAVTAALNLVRKTDLIREKVAEQDFRWMPAIRARVVKEMTVAIIGVGRIGSRVANIYRGFGANVVAYDIAPREEFESLVAYQESAEAAISQADIVTIHMPATDVNYHQFSLDLFKQFKSGAILVNTARGPIVHTEDLFQALEEGYIAGAALDVYEGEAPYVPVDWRGRDITDPVYQQLVKHPQIIYTPHTAYYTDTAVQNLIDIPLDATLSVIQTGDTDVRVN